MCIRDSQGELWHFGRLQYDYCLLHFEDRTVVDDSFVCGHYAVFDNFTTAETTVGGIIHPGSCILAGACVTEAENGPWKFFIGGPQTAKTRKAELSPL